MTKRLFAVATAALAVLLVASTFDPAEARRGGARSFHGGGHARAYSGRAFSGRAFSGRTFSGRAFHGGHRFHRGHRFVRRGIFVGVPLATYGAYYYGDGCGWLRRRALATGSAYWWDRYHACLYGYAD